MNDLTVLPYHIEFQIIYTKQFNPEIVSCCEGKNRCVKLPGD